MHIILKGALHARLIRHRIARQHVIEMKLQAAVRQNRTEPLRSRNVRFERIIRTEIILLLCGNGVAGPALQRVRSCKHKRAVTLLQVVINLVCRLIDLLVLEGNSGIFLGCSEDVRTHDLPHVDAIIIRAAGNRLIDSRFLRNSQIRVFLILNNRFAAFIVILNSHRPAFELDVFDIHQIIAIDDRMRHILLNRNIARNFRRFERDNRTDLAIGSRHLNIADGMHYAIIINIAFNDDIAADNCRARSGQLFRTNPLGINLPVSSNLHIAKIVRNRRGAGRVRIPAAEGIAFARGIGGQLRIGGQNRLILGYLIFRHHIVGAVVTIVRNRFGRRDPLGKHLYVMRRHDIITRINAQAVAIIIIPAIERIICIHAFRLVGNDACQINDLLELQHSAQFCQGIADRAILEIHGIRIACIL